MFARLFISAVASAALFCGPALAQTKSGAIDSSANASQGAQSLPQKIQQKLKSQGFSDVQVVPGSFLVSAKDKDGDPVTMIIGPNSMTVFTIASAGDTSTTGSSGATSNSSANANSSPSSSSSMSK